MSKKPAKNLSVQLEPFVAPFRFDGSGEFHLKSHKTNAKGGLDKDKGEKILEANRKRLSDFQEKLYAQDRWSLLLIFQGMDASGKDSAIKSIFDGVNPQGCEVHSFKQPTLHELNHDFLWRSTVVLPQRGRIGIFNRSYYEECLVVRVHPETLAKEKIPPRLVTRNVWRERFEDISAFERYLARNGTVVLKFFLNVSKQEQRERFLDRPDEELEILDGRCHRARAMGAIPGRLSGGGQAHLEHGGAVACGARRPQMVRAGGDRLDHRARAGKARPEIPRRRRRLAAGIQAGAGRAGERGQAQGEEGRGEEGSVKVQQLATNGQVCLID
jgi:PPK2 family polyphosphate:nucleotide phosphotransferase